MESMDRNLGAELSADLALTFSDSTDVSKFLSQFQKVALSMPSTMHGQLSSYKMRRRQLTFLILIIIDTIL